MTPPKSTTLDYAPADARPKSHNLLYIHAAGVFSLTLVTVSTPFLKPYLSFLSIGSAPLSPIHHTPLLIICGAPLGYSLISTAAFHSLLSTFLKHPTARIARHANTTAFLSGATGFPTLSLLLFLDRLPATLSFYGGAATAILCFSLFTRLCITRTSPLP